MLNNEPIYTIGIIADTHDVLKKEVLEILEHCDYILHAGDITTKTILDTLQEVTTTIAVLGNNDLTLANYLPKQAYFKIGKYRFFMIHDIKEYPNQDADFVIFGHSHKYTFKKQGKTYYINPGGCGRKRFSLPLSLCILTIDDASFMIEKIEI